ncbi:RNA polymerase sigma factor [Hanstruepera marina]|uniref:hypothetical protein n=1 Tax=Hanstruepera marina TaxID=2873265 RepID=UPI001CA79983|nr:hypothetical protein [Hanstruepera marina]
MQQNKATSDGDLIRNYLDGNPDSLKLLIEKWHVHFCNKAFWIVKNTDVSKDIAQDTWQVILAKLQ